jgi:hypothetical protein
VVTPKESVTANAKTRPGQFSGFASWKKRRLTAIKDGPCSMTEAHSVRGKESFATVYSDENVECNKLGGNGAIASEFICYTITIITKLFALPFLNQVRGEDCWQIILSTTAERVN